ncbi:hypothetical protein GCM10007148_22680 [Parvularcula lutaonensis]|nr:hypothetical protein GCM10007148_22680 [Parvularcula lutaonensis]
MTDILWNSFAMSRTSLANGSSAQASSWVADAKAGFLVSLIALPLCLGIAAASGFPPIAGLYTAIIGGCIVSFLGGSRYTIKGPAAGLIVIALGAVTELGGGDMVLGYQRALAVGVVAAGLQFILAYFKTAGLGISMSKSVVHGMLAAIGIIIVAKQLHVLLGASPHAHETFGLLAELPNSLAHANLAVALIGFGSLAVLLLWPMIAKGPLAAVPAQLVVLVGAIAASVALGFTEAGSINLLGQAVETGPQYLVPLPDSIVDGFAFPDFSVVFTPASIKYIIMFALVGMIESTLSVIAVDSIVEKKEKPADLNRDLMAVSVGNMLSSFVGGLPMISEIVRSKASIDAGAQSSKANFFHGLMLLIFLVALPGLVKLVPLSALAAMLVVVGLRLASPKEVQHANEVGRDQLALFLTTLVVTLLTDLLIGVAAGLLLKIVLHFLRGATPKSLFAPKVVTRIEGDHAVMRVDGDAAFPSLLRIKKAASELPDSVRSLTVNVSGSKIVDHTFLSGVDVALADLTGVDYKVTGLEKLTPRSTHPQPHTCGRPDRHGTGYGFGQGVDGRPCNLGQRYAGRGSAPPARPSAAACLCSPQYLACIRTSSVQGGFTARRKGVRRHHADDGGAIRRCAARRPDTEIRSSRCHRRKCRGSRRGAFRGRPHETGLPSLAPAIRSGNAFGGFDRLVVARQEIPPSTAPSVTFCGAALDLSALCTESPCNFPCAASGFLVPAPPFGPSENE